MTGLVERGYRARTRRDIGVGFIAAHTYPDHQIIASFRRGNRAAFETAFLRVLLMARQSGLLELGTASIGSTKIDANASEIRSMRYDRQATAGEVGRGPRCPD